MLPGAITLKELQEAGLLTNPYKEWPEIPSSARNTVQKQIVGYLHANCGNCHKPGYVADYSEFLTDFRVDIDNMDEQPLLKTGLGKKTKYFDIPGIGEDTLRISAGEPEKSALYYRMDHPPDSSWQMPPRIERLDEAAIKLIHQYIKNLAGPWVTFMAWLEN